MRRSEVGVYLTSQQARLAQDTVEAVILPTGGRARFIGLAIEVVVAAPARSPIQAIWLGL